MNNKKAISQTTTVGLISLLLGFLVFFGFFQGVSSKVSDQSQDFACKSLIEFKDTSVGSLTEFLSGITKRCVVDDIKSEAEDVDEVFTEVADEMARCWYRYGEGEQDFLSNFDTQGNWCFLCGKIEFEETDELYSIEDFVKWTQEKENVVTSISEKPTYYEYINFKYAQSSDEDIQEISGALNSLLEAEDSAFKEMAFVLGTQYEYLQDLRAKKIDTSEELFVVYKFDRVDSDFSESLLQATESAAAGAATGFLVGVGVETILWGGASALSCSAAFLTSWTGIGGIVFGTACGASSIKTTTSIARTTYKGVELTKRIAEVTKVSEKITKGIKSSKKTRDIDKIGKRAAAIGTGGAAASGTYSYQLDFHENQYVDIMTKEQYYRLCGTEPILTEN